ncbi:MAG: DUF4250 family protein [Fusobacteria bacterium]|nr:DUF4250 family protein [Fusobacteriota bacterium]
MKEFRTMDLEMFLSILNMKLRDSKSEFEDICFDLNLDVLEVNTYLDEMGYVLKNRRLERV